MRQIGFITSKEKKINRALKTFFYLLLNSIRMYIPPFFIVFCLLFVSYNLTSKDLWIVYSAKSLDQIKISNVEGNIFVKSNLVQMGYTGKVNNGTPLIVNVNDIEYHLKAFELSLSFYLKTLNDIPYGNGVYISELSNMSLDGDFREISISLNDSKDNSLHILGIQNSSIGFTSEFYISPYGEFKLKIQDKEVKIPQHGKITIKPEPDYQLAVLNIVAENPFYLINKRNNEGFGFSGKTSEFESYSRNDSVTLYSDNTVQNKLETENIVVNGAADKSNKLRTDITLNSNEEDISISGRVNKLTIGGKSAFINFLTWISSNTAAISTLVLTALIGMLITRK